MTIDHDEQAITAAGDISTIKSSPSPAPRLSTFQDEPTRDRLPEALLSRCRRRHLRCLIATLSETRSNPTSRTSCGRRSISSTAPVSDRTRTRRQRQGRSAARPTRCSNRSVELERLTARHELIERRNTMNSSATRPRTLRSPDWMHWHPRSARGEHGLDSAVIDSRDFLAAKRRADTEVLLPADRRSPSPAAQLQRCQLDLGQARSGHAKHPTWCYCMAVAEGPRHRRPLGRSPQVPQIALSRIGQTRQGAPFKRTIRCSTCCRSASWSSPHRHSRRTADRRKLGSPSGNPQRGA